MSSMITTTDNPFDPFDEFDQWYTWDTVNGYNSSGLLARVLVTSEALSDADQAADREQAIDDIVQENVSGMHIKVTRE